MSYIYRLLSNIHLLLPPPPPPPPPFPPQARATLQVNAAPDCLPCRESEHNEILAFIQQGLVRGGSPSSLYISGMFGAHTICFATLIPSNVYFFICIVCYKYSCSKISMPSWIRPQHSVITRCMRFPESVLLLTTDHIFP